MSQATAVLTGSVSSMDESETDDGDELDAMIDQWLTDGVDPEVIKLVLDVRVSALEADVRRLHWVQSIYRVANGLIELARSPDDWGTHRRSAAVSDRSAADLVIGARTEPFADLLRYEVALNMRVAADHLHGFGVLVHAQRSALGAASIARGVFEASAWAAGLLDPNVGQTERLRRLIIRRIARLKAGIRDSELLSASSPDVEAQAEEVASAMPDEHGSHLDPAQEIADLEALAQSRGWKVKHTNKGIEVDGRPLSINWLVQNVGQGVGVESYVWGNASALTHGEHTATIASLLAIVQDNLDGMAPAWLMRLNSTGSWAGPRLLLATFAAYTGRIHLAEEFKAMEHQFFDNFLK